MKGAAIAETRETRYASSGVIVAINLLASATDITHQAVPETIVAKSGHIIDATTARMREMKTVVKMVAKEITTGDD